MERCRLTRCLSFPIYEVGSSSRLPVTPPGDNAVRGCVFLAPSSVGDGVGKELGVGAVSGEVTAKSLGPEGSLSPGFFLLENGGPEDL